MGITFAATPGDMPSLLPSTVPSYSMRSRSLPVNLMPPSRRQSTLAAIVLRKKNEVDIILEGEAEYVHSYSTHDEIKGVVEIKFEKDSKIDELIITLEGQTATYVEKIATTAPTTGRTTGKHTFLKLLQPVDSDQLPEDNVAKAGVSYTVPFTFVVPERLLPYICAHKVDYDEVKSEHLQLPPSLGDPSTAGDGHMLMDDFAPAMSRIIYAVHVRVTGRNATGKIMNLAEKTERIRIVPAKEEQPPLNADDESDFVMRKEKSVKKGLFKLGKIGRLAAETLQPRSLRLPHPQKRATEPITTMATVNLRFDPQTPDDQPPRLGSIVSKLRIYTFFGAAPYKVLPQVHTADNWSTLHGLYPESFELSSRCLSTVSWVKHDQSISSTSSSMDLSRRPSCFSTGSTASVPEPSAAYQDGPFYTASVLVPISLPDPYSSSRPKVFVPSFHSCIVSRSYTLELNVSYHTPGTNVSSPHIVLKVPIQISSEGGVAPTPLPESDEAIVAEIEHQFGLYEARQLENELGLNSPEYEDVVPTLGTNRHASLASGAPPEYHAGGGFARRTGGSRTQSDTSSILTRWSSRASGSTMTQLSVLAL